MPEYLRLFLQQLTAEQANSLWDWLDGNPDAIYEMICEVQENKNLKQRENTPLGG